MPRPGVARRILTAALLAGAALGTGACGAGETIGDPVPAASPAVSQAAVSQAPVPQAPVSQAPASEQGSAPGRSGIPIYPATPEASAAPSPPVRVQVEGTGIDLEVIPAGVEDNGAMSIPDNHYQAGWYRFGAGPGASAGSAVLAAHVDSQTEALPIAGLKDVPVGTKVTVTLEDGSAVVYQTEQVENIAKRSLDGHRLFDRTGDHLLKLVTCGGKWLDAENDYEDNVVLTAAPLS